MPVTWPWKRKIGYYTLVQKHTYQTVVDVFGNQTTEGKNKIKKNRKKRGKEKC